MVPPCISSNPDRRCTRCRWPRRSDALRSSILGEDLAFRLQMRRGMEVEGRWADDRPGFRRREGPSDS